MLSLTPFLPLVTQLLLLISLKPVHISATTPVAFINPPPLRQEDRDDSKNAVYKIGSTMTLQWTEDTEVRSSLVLYQVPGDEFEYVAPNHVQITDYLWIVNTAKNLSFSNVFQFAMYSNGSTTPNATSHNFNITSASSSSSSSSPNLSAGSLPVTTTSSASPLPSSTGITTTKTSAGADVTPASTDGGGALQKSQESGGSNKKLSTPSAIGIGVGVSSALFLAIAGAFAYWIFKVRPRRRNSISHHHVAVELPPPPPQTPHTGFGGGPTMVMNGNGNTMYQTKDIFGGELQGHNGPGRNGGSSVYEIDSQTGGAFAWDRARK